MSEALRKAIADLDDDCMVPIRFVRRKLEEGPDPDTVWVGIEQACSIIGDVPATTLRARARRWLALQERGLTPEIRVTKTGTGEASHWRFHMGDCYRVRRQNGGGPRLVKAEEKPQATEEDRIVAHYVAAIGADP